MALKLTPRAVEKPWGQFDLPVPFPNVAGRKIGEVWFEAPADKQLPLLVKYLFTSERLSIQVHPDDAQAAGLGLRSGKEECWYILDCEPGSTLGIGLTAALSEADVRAAIADGSIERLMDWKPVEPGDFFFIPAGTVHAIGAGITLVEVQQSADVTYRLYDYGRPRELHLEQGLAVSRLARYDRDPVHVEMGQCRTLLGPGIAPFRLEMTSWDARSAVRTKAEGQSWFIPLHGDGTIDGETFEQFECWLIDETTELTGGEAGTALVASLDEQRAHGL